MKRIVKRILLIGFSIIALFNLSAIIMADVLLHDTFDKDTLSASWAPSDAKFVYAKKGVLVLDQKGSGTDWVGVNTNPPPFGDCVIYHEWVLAEYTGQGDCGGPIRKSFGTYHMRWGWGNTVNLVDSVAHGAIPAWNALPTVDGRKASSPYPPTSKRFIVKAYFKTPKIKIQIFDMDDGNKKIADWELKDDFYANGVMGFDCWKFGVVHVDNVVVATLDWEKTVFSDNFDPVNLKAGGQAVNNAGKLSTTWSKIKN